MKEYIGKSSNFTRLLGMQVLNSKLTDLNDIRLANAEVGVLSRVISTLFSAKKLLNKHNNPSILSSPKPRPLAAFSLIELMVTLGVIAIGLTLAIPSFRTMVMNNRISTSTDAFANALNYARNTALTLAVTVKVCPVGAANSVTCGASWANGWLVATVPTTGVGTLLMSQQNGANDATVSSGTSIVNFDAQGLASTQSNFAICDSRGSTYARSVQVLPTGYVQTGQTMGVAVWNNGAISCP